MVVHRPPASQLSEPPVDGFWPEDEDPDDDFEEEPESDEDVDEPESDEPEVEDDDDDESPEPLLAGTVDDEPARLSVR